MRETSFSNGERTLSGLAHGLDALELLARRRGEIALGETTKAARNWLGNKLDASKRSQVMFMDRNDILNLFVVKN